jgi:hypothetical protein
VNPLDDFFRRKGSVFVVEAVCSAVGGEHVKLHEVNVLAHRVSWSAHLKVILDVNARHQVGVLERDAIVRVGAEEEWLRRFCAVERRFHVAPQS